MTRQRPPAADASYRLATIQDLDLVVEHRLHYLEEAYERVTDHQRIELRKALTEHFQEELGHRTVVALALSGGTCVAGAHMLVHWKPANLRFPNGRTGEIINVFTTPQHRRRGHATRCMELLLEHAHKLELASVNLESSPDGVGVYANLGFQRQQTGYIQMRYPIDVWL